MARSLIATLALGGLAFLPIVADGADARRAVETFVSHLAGVRVTDLTVRQTLTIYHADGRYPQSTAEQVVYVKLPRRQRLEQMIEGRREVRIAVDDRAWVREPDGTVRETGRDAARDRTNLVVPLARNADELLAEWKALGVRDDVSWQTRLRGRPVTVIGAGPGEKDRPAVWLDADYGVVRLITRERLPDGEALLDLALSEHRPVQSGFYVPYRQELFANGRLLVLMTVRSVTANSNLPDGLFDPDALRRER